MVTRPWRTQPMTMICFLINSTKFRNGWSQVVSFIATNTSNPGLFMMPLSARIPQNGATAEVVTPWQAFEVQQNFRDSIERKISLPSYCLNKSHGGKVRQWQAQIRLQGIENSLSFEVGVVGFSLVNCDPSLLRSQLAKEPCLLPQAHWRGTGSWGVRRPRGFDAVLGGIETFNWGSKRKKRNWSNDSMYLHCESGACAIFKTNITFGKLPLHEFLPPSLKRKDANGTHLMIQQILKCLQVTRSVSASNPKVMTSETWFECPLRSGLSTWILSWVTPVKASGSPETPNASGVKQSLSWLFLNTCIFWHKMMNIFSLLEHKCSMFFLVGLLNLRSLRFGNSEKIYDIIHDICMRAKQTSRPAPGAKAWSIQNGIVSSFWYPGGGQSFGQYISIFSTDLAWAKPKPSLVRAFLRTANWKATNRSTPGGYCFWGGSWWALFPETLLPPVLPAFWRLTLR